MASSSISTPLALLALAALYAPVGCAGSEPRFPLRESMKKDTDLTPVFVACHADPTPKDPKHTACAPKVYVSPLAWDGIDNSVFRPLSDTLAVEATREAENADAFDEVADSAWFTNRIGEEAPSLEELSRGACTPKQVLDARDVKDGSWVIDKGKDNGSTAGFRVKIPGKGKYMLKSDAPILERPSGSAVIGAAVYFAAGFNFTCEQIVYVKRSVFKLTPGLTVTDNTEHTRPFDDKAMNKVLDGVNKRGDRLRFQASAWLDGRLIGPFTYEGTRKDDPNDVIPHQHRRELRGGRLIAAWIDHFDAREQNSMDLWVASDPSKPDSSPGYVRHFYLDTSDTLGSEWDWDLISRRLGQSYLLDWGDIGLDFITLGFYSRPWDRARREPGQELFGYYSTRDFDPETWVNEYPNPAFSRMTERDGAWMARILAGFTPAHVHALAVMGNFSRPESTAYLEKMMEGRLAIILERYLTRLSPLGRVHIEGSALCATDLAAMRGLRPADRFRYRALTPDGKNVAVEQPEPAKICVPLTHISADGGAAPDSPERYHSIAIANGVARSPLVVHFYDLGPSSGFRLAGIERPSGSLPNAEADH